MEVFVCRFALCVQFQGGVWSLNMVVCDGLMTMDVMLCTASIFNLCAISVDRYVYVYMNILSDLTGADVESFSNWLLLLK